MNKFNKIYEEVIKENKSKTKNDVEKLKKKFPKIKGIQVLSDWSGKSEDDDNIHLGDVAEGGEIDGLPAAGNLEVNSKLKKELKKLGYGLIEWYDSGTVMAYKD